MAARPVITCAPIPDLAELIEELATLFLVPETPADRVTPVKTPFV